LVPMAEKLFEAPKKAILLGLTIGYSGLSCMEFSIYILHQQTCYFCGLQLKITKRDQFFSLTYQIMQFMVLDCSRN
jgi:hypothetical protein